METFEKEIEYEAFLAKQENCNFINMKELNKRKTPIVVIDNSLEKYKDLPLFQEKVDKANEMLRTVGLPKGKSKHHSISK